MAEVAYKGPLNVKPSQANKVPVFQQPPYEDVGVSYGGFSKTKLAANKWQLNRQETRHVSLVLGNGAFGSTLFTRPESGKTFYCTGIQFHWKLGGGIFGNQFHISDVNDVGSAEIRIYEFAYQTGEQNFFINLKDCPRKFSGNRFDLYTQGSFSSGDFLHVQLFGWEE